MKPWIVAAAVLVVIAVGIFAITKKVSPVSWNMWGTYNAASGVAIKGYDPVAYFKAAQPVLGSERYTVVWSGAQWRFATEENKEAFSKNPESFAPQFGGFCSFAVSKGFTADTSPDAWHIDGGKLYLFADSKVEHQWIDGITKGSLKASTEQWAKR